MVDGGWPLAEGLQSFWVRFCVVVVDLGGSALPSTSSRGGGGARPWLGSVPRAMGVVVVVVGWVTTIGSTTA